MDAVPPGNGAAGPTLLAGRSTKPEKVKVHADRDVIFPLAQWHLRTEDGPGSWVNF